MLESDIRKKVVATAKSLLADPAAHRRVIDDYNQISPLPRGYKMSMRDAWCAATVSAIAYETHALDIIPAECSCPYMINAFQAAGRWVEDDKYRPAPGDIIFYDWQDSGAGDNRGTADHVGVVELTEGDRITVIEGNRHDQMGHRHLYVGGRFIRGFATPAYHAYAAAVSAHHLAKLGVIDSPEYWRAASMFGTPEYIADLLGKAANVITHAAPRCSSLEDALSRLRAAGVATSTDYWRAQAMVDCQMGHNINQLLRALGGAV